MVMSSAAEKSEPIIFQRKPDTRRVLTRKEAIDVYDRAGAAIRDSSSVYGGPATQALLQAADLAAVNSVFEFGSGSGGLADLLLSSVLHCQCQYYAVDQSPVQVGLTQQRMKQYGARAQVHVVSGSPSQAAADLPDASVDAFISTYVLDILSDEDIDAVLTLAYRLLRPGGQLCLIGLTYGDTLLSRLATGVWGAVYAVRPQIVGGCRPQNLVPYLDSEWNLTTVQCIPGRLLRSQVIVANKL